MKTIMTILVGMPMIQSSAFGVEVEGGGPESKDPLEAKMNDFNLNRLRLAPFLLVVSLSINAFSQSEECSRSLQGESFTETFRQQMISDLENRPKFAGLSAEQQQRLRNGTNFVVDQMGILERVFGKIEGYAQSSADTENTHGQRPAQMDPQKYSLIKRHTFWLKVVNKRRSVLRSLNELFFQTKYDNTDLSQFFENRDLSKLYQLYFDQFYQELNLPKAKRSSWEGNNEFYAILGQIAKREFDDETLLAIVDNIVSDPNKRRVFMMTKAPHLENFGNQIQLLDSFLVETILRLQYWPHHLQLKAKLINKLFQYKDEMGNDFDKSLSSIISGSFRSYASDTYFMIQSQMISELGHPYGDLKEHLNEVQKRISSIEELLSSDTNNQETSSQRVELKKAKIFESVIQKLSGE